jgi:lauroyl/myristoyl acyltransferase
LQARLPTPHRIADALHRWALRWGFPALARIAPRWPRGLLHLGARWVIALVMAVYPRPKRAIAANLARVTGRPVRSREVRRAVRRMLHNFAYSWVDLFRFAQLPAERGTRELVRADGLERVQDALAAGHGAILLTAHLGNWELGGVLLGRRERLSVVYVRDRYQEAERFRSLWRSAGNVEEIAVDPGSSLASLPVLRALRRNGVVGMQGDRDFDGQGVWVPFFGAPAPFPRGPFLVALLTGAPLLPTFVTYTPDRRFQVEVLEPIHLDRGGDRERAVVRAIGQWARVLEELVRRHPTQWYTFYDLWSAAR